jgi:hypothetical protein
LVSKPRFGAPGKKRRISGIWDFDYPVETPAIVNGRTFGAAKFALTATETPSGIIAAVNYGEKPIGQLGFAAGAVFENGMATIRNLLTP